MLEGWMPKSGSSMRCGGTPDRTVDPPCMLQLAGSPLLLGGRNRGVKQAIPQNRTEPANLQDLSLRDMARHERYLSNAAVRRTIHVMNVVRVIPRRRASLSMHSATSSSKVSPARTLLPEGLINGMDTHVRQRLGVQPRPCVRRCPRLRRRPRG